MKKLNQMMAAGVLALGIACGEELEENVVLHDGGIQLGEEQVEDGMAIQDKEEAYCDPNSTVADFALIEKLVYEMRVYDCLPGKKDTKCIGRQEIIANAQDRILQSVKGCTEDVRFEIKRDLELHR